MSFTDWINEQIYILFSMYYYEVFLYKNKIQIGRFIQAESFSPDYLVDFKRKIAFHIIKDRFFVKGHKLIFHCNKDLAIPLEPITETSIKELNKNVIQISKTTKLIGKVTSEVKKKSEPIQITESNYPPHMLFEVNNSHFVTAALAKPKPTDWGFVILAIGVIIFLIAFMAIIVFGVLKG